MRKQVLVCKIYNSGITELYHLLACGFHKEGFKCEETDPSAGERLRLQVSHGAGSLQG